MIQKVDIGTQPMSRMQRHIESGSARKHTHLRVAPVTMGLAGQKGETSALSLIG
jgi:hypothetical protein